MTDGEALLATVIESPDDDTPRLVYADWLDENEQPERAELIRVQVELAPLPEPSELTIGILGTPTAEQRHKRTCPVCRSLADSALCRYHTLTLRADELLSQHGDDWVPRCNALWDWLGC